MDAKQGAMKLCHIERTALSKDQLACFDLRRHADLVLFGKVDQNLDLDKT